MESEKEEKEDEEDEDEEEDPPIPAPAPRKRLAPKAAAAEESIDIEVLYDSDTEGEEEEEKESKCLPTSRRDSETDPSIRKCIVCLRQSKHTENIFDKSRNLLYYIKILIANLEMKQVSIMPFYNFSLRFVCPV